MANVLYSFLKAMFKNSNTGNFEIPNFQSPQIKYIFDIPFEFRIGVAFVGTWVGFVAFDHVTDIIGRKYYWILGLIVILLICWLIKQSLGIGPSGEDIVALFDEERDAVEEMMSKNWKPVTSNEVMKYAIGKPVVLQWVSQQYGNLYLTDEKKPDFTFAKKIEHAGEFQLIAAPRQDSADAVAFFSESRKLYITNTLLGYLKVEGPRMGSWELYQMDFNTGKTPDVFQLRSVSRGRHIMHLREGNFHKGFHDKFGEIAMFRMFYYDESGSPQSQSTPEGQRMSSDKLLTDGTPILIPSSSPSESESEDASGSVENNDPDISNIVGSAVGWRVISKGDKIPFTNPFVIYLNSDGFLQATESGSTLVTPSIEGATRFQICKVPNETSFAFFSRFHRRYLSLGGVLVSKLRVEGAKYNNWEKFKIIFDKEQPTKCYLKALKTWPPPKILRSHIISKGKPDKSVASFTLLYHEQQII
jgi:hypothetical protein